VSPKGRIPQKVVEAYLEANPNTDARGVAIEANLDKGRGAVATMLVQRGTLHVGDSLVVGSSYGRVRAMFDDAGNDVSEAGPSTPVAVLGLTSVPRAGDSFLVANDDRTARQIADKREAAERQALLAKRRKRVSLEDFDKVLAEGEVDTLNLVIKGDVSGAVEALEDSLLRIDVGDEGVDGGGVVADHLADGAVRDLRPPPQGQVADGLDDLSAQVVAQPGLGQVCDPQARQVEGLGGEERSDGDGRPSPWAAAPALR